MPHIDPFTIQPISRECCCTPAGGKPRLLDLFCGAGGAAMGYHRAGFEVVGVDIEPQPNYPFEFEWLDALEAVRILLDRSTGGLGFLAPLIQGQHFDAIHASPPCQRYLNLTRVNETMGRDHSHVDLIAGTRDLLEETGLPYVIENVPDAGAKLINPVRVCGTSFNLPLRRHRLFESNVPLVGTTCEHGRFTEKRYWTGWRPKGEHRLSTVVQVYGNAADKHEWPTAMGIDWMTAGELAEAIPPAYTEHIGGYLTTAVARESAKHSAACDAVYAASWRGRYREAADELKRAMTEEER
jgi:DNA (cytosine-5)-methyltransferase 1